MARLKYQVIDRGYQSSYKNAIVENDRQAKLQVVRKHFTEPQRFCAGAFNSAYNLIVLKVKSTRKEVKIMVTKEEFKENLLALLDIINNR